MRQTINKGKVHYDPNSVGGGCPFQAKMKDGGFVSHTERVDAHKIRARSKSFNDYFSQATLFWNSQTPPEQEQITKAFLFELGKVESQDIQMRMVGLLTQVDKDLAKNVAEGLGFEVPDGPMEPVQHGVPADHEAKDYAPIDVTQAIKKDKALSMEYSQKEDITSRMIAFLCADGVDGKSVHNMKEALMKKGAVVKIIAPHLGAIKTAVDGENLRVDKSFSTTGSVLFDAVYIPSGEISIKKLKKNAEAVKFLHETYKHCKPFAMDGDAKLLLEATYIENLVKSIDAHKEGVILKKEGEGLAEDFIHAIGQHRYWNREKTNLIPT